MHIRHKKIREKTWFGVDRSKKYNLCNTVGFKGSTCWIPSAPQKTYLNQDWVAFKRHPKEQKF